MKKYNYIIILLILVLLGKNIDLFSLIDKKDYNRVHANLNNSNNYYSNNYTLKPVSNYEDDDYNEEEYPISLYFFFNPSYTYHGSNWIYVGDDDEFEILANVNSSADEEKIEGDILNLYSWGTILTSYNLVKFTLGNLKYQYKDIYIPIMSYDEFISNITATNCTYKILDGESEINSGKIKKNMTLKVYYKEQEVDSYNINVTEKYVDFDKLTIKNNKYLLNKVSTVNELKQLIDTNGNIVIQDKDGNILNDGEYLTTNSKVKIDLTDYKYEYTIVILGDVTGSGDIFIGDITKLYRYFKNELTMEECYVIAGDVTQDGVIDISDIAKLYQYFKKIINSL